MDCEGLCTSIPSTAMSNHTPRAGASLSDLTAIMYDGMTISITNPRAIRYPGLCSCLLANRFTPFYADISFRWIHMGLADILPFAILEFVPRGTERQQNCLAGGLKRSVIITFMVHRRSLGLNWKGMRGGSSDGPLLQLYLIVLSSEMVWL